MARWVFWKIWSVVMFSLALLGVDAKSTQAVESEFARALSAVPLKRSSKPDLFLQLSSTDASGATMLAGHRSHSSHSSHSSHRSHSSHYSGSGGYSPPSSSGSSFTPSSPSTTRPKASGITTFPSASDQDVSKKKIKKIFMRNGASLPCDSAWVDGGKWVNFMRAGTVYNLPLEDIDLDRTLKESE
ncbi:MAG: hypothetical protein AB9873_13075 [Syntrophobacteraceae bacterium]